MEMENIKISELPSLQTIDDDAFFAIECPETKISLKLPYRELKSIVFDQLGQILGLQSMAYKSKSEYARFAHGHNYTDFWLFPSYGPQSNNSQYKDALCCQVLGKVAVTKYFPGPNASSTSQISVCAPAFKTVEQDESLLYDPRAVGDIQMVASHCTFEQYLEQYRGYSLKQYGDKWNVDIYADSFDGYVIPNGTTFSCGKDDFKDACRAYAVGKDPLAASFTVPDLASFVKGNPGINLSSAMEQVPYQNGLAKHDHKTSSSQDGKQIDEHYYSSPLNFPPMTFFQYSSATDSSLKTAVPWFLHGGGGKPMTKAELSVVGIDIDAKIVDIAVHSAGDEGESYPTHRIVPVLMYIGQKG